MCELRNMNDHKINELAIKQKYINHHSDLLVTYKAVNMHVMNVLLLNDV